MKPKLHGICIEAPVELNTIEKLTEPANANQGNSNAKNLDHYLMNDNLSYPSE